MCIHLGMNIKHESIWSTTYCVPAYLCAQHCIICTRRLVRRDPTSLVSVLFCSPDVDQGARGILLTVCAYSFSVCRIQISQVCITNYVGLEPKLYTCIYLQFVCITFLCMLPVSIITQFKLNQILYLVSVQQVFIQYRYFFDSSTVISFQLITC